MYWLRWHYHVKDIAEAPYKINKKKKNKQNDRIAEPAIHKYGEFMDANSNPPNHKLKFHEGSFHNIYIFLSRHRL